jgi:hypothetical protein
MLSKKYTTFLYYLYQICIAYNTNLYYNISVERRIEMFGIYNLKDFLETLAYVVAIVLGIKEILKDRKGN